MLPDGSGYDVCRTLRQRSAVPIIMLTARGEETDRIVGLELGADDYIVKPFSAREVAARIRAVLRRSSGQQDPAGQPPAPLEAGELKLEPARRSATHRGEELDLTRKEFGLLELLLREAGNVVSRERLIDEVWDVNWFGSTKTLDVHISSLRRKLGDDSAAPRYIHTVRGVGFRFAAADELPAAGEPARRPAAAFAYVLVLVIVALEVPLALNLGDGWTPRSRARRRAGPAARASASGRLATRRSSMRWRGARRATSAAA